MLHRLQIEVEPEESSSGLFENNYVVSAEDIIVI